MSESDDIPEYRSPEWRRLPASDPRKHAAMVIAADRWAVIAASPHAQELVTEVYDWTRRRIYSDWSSAVSALAAGHMPGPSYAELARRRAVVGPLPEKVAERHGGPYRGGPVDWHTGQPARQEAA